MTDTDQILKRITAIRSDPRHPYNNRLSPAHDAAVREVNALYDRLYPNGVNDELDISA